LDDAKETFERHFDEIAESYDADISFSLGYRQMIPYIIKSAKIKPTDIVVDIGCGTGKLSLILASVAKKIIATDISSKMLKKARKEAEKNDIHNIEFKKANCINLPIKKSSIDVIVSNLVLHHLTDEEKLNALKEFYRVLKPKGKIIIGDLVKSKKGFREEISFIVENYKKVYGVQKTFDKLIEMIERMFFITEYPTTLKRWDHILSLASFRKNVIKQIRGPLWVLHAIKC